MTKLQADRRCDSCGGLLVPREMATVAALPANADYICLQCGRPYRWFGKPPRLVTLSLAEPPASDSES